MCLDIDKVLTKNELHIYSIIAIIIGIDFQFRRLMST